MSYPMNDRLAGSTVHAMTERTVLVTGSSTGIGAACVARLAGAGWRVYAGVRSDGDGRNLVDLNDGDIRPVLLDVTDRSSIDRAIVRIDDEAGQLDGVVNNAGIAVAGPFEIVEEAEWRSQFDVNLFGAIAVTRASFPLVERAGGRFVHIGSIAGRVASAGMGPYAASKHAIAAMNWALRAELAHWGPMQSSVVEPGSVKTAIWDKGHDQLRDAEQRLDRTGLTGRYGWLLDLFRGFLAEAEEKGIDPDRVAHAVEHALTADRPKARYLVGIDARAQAVIAKMPDRWREFVLAKAADRYVSSGASVPADDRSAADVR